MTPLEDELVAALERRAAEVDVHSDLDGVREGRVAIRSSAASTPGRTPRARRVLAAAGVVALIGGGVVAFAAVNRAGSLEDGAATATETDVPEGGTVLPKPLGSVSSIAIDEWVIPTAVPEGFEFQYAANLRTGGDMPGDRQVQYGEDADQARQITIQLDTREPFVEGETIDLGGVTWTVERRSASAFAEAVIGGVLVSIGGPVGSAEEFDRMLSSAVVVESAGLPAPPILFALPNEPGSSMVQVGAFEFDERTYTVSADGTNGWFCTSIYAENDGGGGGCASFFDPAGHLQPDPSAGTTVADGAADFATNIHGLASTDTARVEVEWIDGQVTEVVPVNTSGRFADTLFWATGATIDLEPGQSPDSLGESVVEVRAFDASGALIATARRSEVILPG